VRAPPITRDVTRLQDLLATGAVRAHFQPIVDLATGAVVGHEALARGPEGSDLQSPDRLFAAARTEGLLGELDAACRRSALRDAASAGIARPSALFVNVEPACFDGPARDEASEATLIVEITERGLATRPAELLLAVERVRARGWGIAVDDVGADWRSLALMPLLRPDVVKLDRHVLARDAGEAADDVVRGACAYVRRHGALLLAEGIEDAPAADRARAFGARLGQGWLFGRPAPAPSPVPPPVAGQATVGIVQARRPLRPETPFEVLRRHGGPQGVATKTELLAASIELEHAALEARDPAVVFGCFQRADRFGARVAERYARLAEGAAFVGAFGVGLAPDPAPGVRGAALADGETLTGEWTVTVVGPDTARALIARDLGDRGPDADRRFEYALVDAEDLVLDAARALMLRVAADVPAARRATVRV
jgi:EAL domain-containing protein (putative c-di-GMP-specific phosphodiesterase class I)